MYRAYLLAIGKWNARILHGGTGHSESLISEERHHGGDEQVGECIAEVGDGEGERPQLPQKGNGVSLACLQPYG